MMAGKTEKRSGLKKDAIVSIHDVMPANLDKILEIIVFLKKAKVHAISLLIVAGMKWRPNDIALLKNMQSNGEVELVGHGWRHRIDGFGTLKHRLHGVLISRNEAEHMSLTTNEIAELVERNYSWFQRVGLAAPDLYMPPAWAMGKISRKRMRRLPFRYYETLIGVYDSFRDCTHPMAVCGYMADTWYRSVFLRLTNAINRQIFPYPLRIAVHPDDLKLSMAVDLASCLNKDLNFSTYNGFLEKNGFQKYPVV